MSAETFDFQPDHDGTLPWRSAVFQALGAASTCWENMSGTGVFDSDRAKAIGDALIGELAQQMDEARAEVERLREENRELKTRIYLVHRSILAPMALVERMSAANCWGAHGTPRRPGR